MPAYLIPSLIASLFIMVFAVRVLRLLRGALLGWFCQKWFGENYAGEFIF
nr:hypothetical protein [Citrobacter freundii]